MPKTDHLQGALEIARLIETGLPTKCCASKRLLVTESGFLTAEWRISDAGRRVRFCKITTKGRKRLTEEEQRWKSVTSTIGKVLRTV